MKKRIISILLCTVMLLCAIPFSASATTPDTVRFEGQALKDAVVAGNSPSNADRSFELNNGVFEYTRLTSGVGTHNFDVVVNLSPEDYPYVGMKYRIDMSGVAESVEHKIDKIAIAVDFNAADALDIRLGNKWEWVATTDSSTSWLKGTNKTIIVFKSSSSAAQGNYREAGVVIQIEELVFFKNQEDAINYNAKTEFADKAYCRGIQTNGQNVRILATIDATTAENVGFNVKVSSTNGTKTFEKSTTTVYTSVLAAGETVTAYDLGGTYVFALVIENIPIGEATFTVTPTVDGVDCETVTITATMTAIAES